MPDLPRGTVTFLFTDIEDSTRLLHELGDGYADVLAEHRRVLREAFARHGGVEVDTQGDAFFVAFARASDAVAAAEELQRALSDASNSLLQGVVRVRIGLHTGEPALTDEGYVGADVHRAARIMSAGHGGQVLVSQATRDLLDERFPLRDLGEHRLKDLSAPHRLWQLGDGDFPPLRTLHQSNLPPRTVPLLGRKRELAELVRLFRGDAGRLVTLTGPGGIGKTRLAVELAAELVDDFDDGAWFVDLSPVRAPELVPRAISGALGADSVEAAVRGRARLLVLDNFEQVVAAAPAVADLLRIAPRTDVIVTSREPLRVAAEREYRLRPLAEAPAVELFRARAEEAANDFDVDYDVASEICNRLDGLPLAIELAAAHARTLSGDELLGRLEERLPLLERGRRDAPSRQRTLRAAIEWSYELLSAAERRLFDRLGVFVGGFTIAAAEAVCDADLETLECLVDKNLVHRDGLRFGPLETIREYAVERLREADDADVIRRRHAEFFLAVAESSNLAAEREGPQRHDLVIPEQHNMRAALAWALAADEVELGMALVVELENFWATADPDGGLQWASAFLGRDAAVPRVLRARALRVKGGMLNRTGTFAAAREAFEQSLAEFRELSDEQGTAILLHRLASTARMTGEWDRAHDLAEQSLALYRRTGFRKGEPQALTTLGQVAWLRGDAARALELLLESARIAEEIGFRWWLMGTSSDVALVYLELGQATEARRWALHGLSLAHAIGDRRGLISTLALAAEAAKADDEARAGRLWGALEAELERASTPLFTLWLNGELRTDRVTANGSPEFDRARAEGRALALADAVEEALRDA